MAQLYSPFQFVSNSKRYKTAFSAHLSQVGICTADSESLYRVVDKMEALRSIALRNFEKYDKFDDHGSHELRLVEMHAHAVSDSADVPSMEINTLSESALLSQIHTIQQVDGLRAALRVVIVPTSQQGGFNEGLGISQRSVRELCETFGIDPTFLHLLQESIYGLHTLTTESGIFCGYVSHTRYQLLWAFNSTTLQTDVILIVRGKAADSFQRVLPSFLNILGLQRCNIFNPYTMAFVALIDLMLWSDQARCGEWAYVPEFEVSRKPMHDSWESGFKRTMGNLATALERMEATNHRFARLQRNMKLASTLTQIFESAAPGEAWFGDRTDDQRAQLEAAYNRDVAAFLGVMAPMRQRIEAGNQALAYMTSQTAARTSAVFALMTHEDAQLSVQIAQASRDLAEATKRDGASMKTVAIMSMLFLPGTFLATVYSILDTTAMTGGGSWIYAIVTVLLTFVVFLAWFMINYDNPLRTAVSRMSNRTALFQPRGKPGYVTSGASSGGLTF